MHSKLIKMLIVSDKHRAPTKIDIEVEPSTQLKSFVEPDEHSVTEVVNFLEKQIRDGKVGSQADIACNRNHLNQSGLQLLVHAKKRSLSKPIIDIRPPTDHLPCCKQNEPHMDDNYNS